MRDLLASVPERVAFLHAHPDDECLSTGALIAELARRGHQVAVVTATRGEMGEVTDAFAGLAGTPALAELRAKELAAALDVLGAADGAFLGEPPARAGGRAPRRYLDSGMTWVTPEWAGPAPGTGPGALSRSDREEAALDVAAYLRSFGAQLVVSYDPQGGYGHPDHVRCHQLAAAAARETGTPMWQIGDASLRAPGPAEVLVRLPEHRATVTEALARHASQLVVAGETVVYSGGQRHPVPLSFILGPVPL